MFKSYNLKQKFSENFLKYLFNTSWLFFEKVLRLISGIFVGIWIARYLGPKDFGLFNYVQSFVGVFAILANLGLDTILVRELVLQKHSQNEVLSTAFLLKLFGSFLLILLLIFILYYTNESKYNVFLVLVIASATIFQAFTVIDHYFQSIVASKYIVYANVFSLIISNTIKIILLVNKASLLSFSFVVLYESFFVAVFYTYFLIKKSKDLRIKLTFKKQIAYYLLNDSWPVILSGIVISIYMRVDQVIIKQLLNTSAVGQYAAAVRLSEAWYFIPMVISTSLYPALINAKKNSKAIYLDRLQKLYDLMTWMAIIVAIPMTFFSDWIVQILYGSDYSESGSVLKVHIWTGVFVFIGLAFSSFLTVENLTKKSFYRTLLGAIVNIALNYIFIPKYGIIGSAYATLIAQIFANYIYDLFDKSLHYQFVMKSKSLFPIHYLRKYKKINQSING